MTDGDGGGAGPARGQTTLVVMKIERYCGPARPQAVLCAAAAAAAMCTRPDTHFNYRHIFFTYITPLHVRQRHRLLQLVNNNNESREMSRFSFPMYDWEIVKQGEGDYNEYLISNCYCSCSSYYILNVP